MKRISLLLFAWVVCSSAQIFNGGPLTHTYSIVARDTITGEMGVAVQSHWFSVGSIVSWAEAGVGAVATQSLVNVSFGQRGLDLLRRGKTAGEVLKELLSSDEGADFRQVAIVDGKGNIAVHTGKKCIAEAGHIIGGNYSVQANMMLNSTIWPAMSKAFEAASGPLAERMVAALKAAENQGGDIRGQQSAAVLVVRGQPTGKIWEDRIIDIRVEDHPDAVDEIERILRVYRAYEHMNKGDLAIEHGDEQAALREYSTAGSMFPDNIEMKYWHAVSLVNIGKIESALPMFRSIFEKDSNWISLTQRIVENGLLIVDSDQLERIISLRK